MRSRPWTWFVVSLLCFVGAYYCWKWADKKQAEKSVTVPEATTPAIKTNPASVALSNAQAAFESKLNPAKAAAQSATNRLAFVLNNTGLTVSKLEQNDTAILLANALIDTSKPLNFSIPDHLKSHGDPGTYVIQSRGMLTKEFRDALAAAGGKIIFYIPNNALEVRLSTEGARQMSGNPLTQSVMPFEPYYKLQSSLLGYAVEQKPMPLTARLNMLVADDAMEETKAELKKLNVAIMKESSSPFGRVLTVRPQLDSLSALAQLTGVVLIEKHYERAKANDLTRQAIGVSADSVTTTNWLNLSGSNVMVLLPDSGVDATHPDLLGRVFGWAITDLDGHGTHVAGIIAGDGTQSLTVSTNVQGSIMPATNQQFRGMAPLAKIMSVSFDNYFQGSINHDIGLIPGGSLSDAYFQETAALTNALIVNNSWGYVDDFEYDLAAANWDWATRDALPGVTGSQPVLAVWAAGNNGNGDDDGGGGLSETIQSPGTSKNGVTVGGTEHPRNITNEVTVTEGGVTNKFTPWLGETDTDYEVASFSGRGNVGIGVESDRGRFKPDVVAPGVMIVSTRSQQWDESFYLNHTNVIQNRFSSEIVDTNFPNYYPVYVPDNAVAVSIRIVPNGNSPIPFPNLPIYVSAVGFPDPNGAYDFSTVNNRVSIPSDGGAGYLQTVAGVGFTIAVADSTNIQVSYDIVTTIFVTNNTGDYFPVLSNLNSTVGPWYRYESGTSMAAPAVSGTLALMQEFFAGKNLLPSPALMKALLINGARPTGFYNVAVQNTINFQGWGLINLPNTLPPGITSLATGTGGSMYFLDQSPTNALVTGSAQTYNMTLVSSNAAELPMRITLAWTDPPGNPSAAIKLVNDLNLVVTNLDDPLNPMVYYGNDITAVSSPYNVPEGTNAPVFDAVNNVENIFLPPNAGTNFTITVIGHRINVNAVTAHTNDVAQDYALVISCGNGEVTNAMTVTTSPGVYTISPNITVYTNFATLPLLNQHVSASSPMLGLNTVPLGTNTSWAAANGVITIGETNQWHFYVVTNTTGFTNAAFVTFIPPELSVSRIGARESSIANATRGEADIELYVSTDPNLLNLDPAAVQAADKSVTRGGTEFIAYQKPLSPIYYIGVKSEDQQAAEFAFYSVFSQDPFSQRDADGNLLVRGINVPTIIPDGSPAHPGVALVLALAIEPVQIRNIILTNLMTHEDFGDLVGTLSHIRKPVTLNNHTFSGVQTGTDPNQYLLMYDDSEEASTPGTRHTDGPGRLLDYVGDQGMGLWLMSQVDNALSHTGAVNALTIKIVPHIDTNVVDLTVQPNSFAYDSIEVPVEATNLSITLTFRNGSVGPVELYARRDAFPTRTAYDKSLLGIVPPGGTLTIDTSDFPPLNPGRYYIGVFNPTLIAQDVRLTYSIGLNIGGVTPVVFASTNTTPILDDAVTYATTYVDADRRIARVDVGVAITHPRVSDLALVVISPSGRRVLLSENRGGLSVDGMGGISYTTNAAPPASSGDFNASTNVLSGLPLQPGVLWVDYNFFNEPDTLHVYYGDVNNQIFDSGLISGTNRFTINLDGTADKVILIMNEGGNTNSATTLWTYNATAVTANQNALTFTENTNLAKLPIKFAPTPFKSDATAGTNIDISTLETVSSGDYTNGQVVDGWTVISNQVSVVADSAVAFEGNQFLALGAGNISQTLPTVTGRKYTLTYRYRGPSAVSLWRAENDGLDSISKNDAVLVNGLGFAAGEVGQAFNYNGPTKYARVPASSSLDVGAGSGITLDSWINVTPNLVQLPIFEWSQPSGGDPAQGVHFWVMAGASALSLYASIRESNSINAHQVLSPSGLITSGSFYHVALAYDKATGIARFYLNGAMITQTNIGILRPLTTYDLYLGRRITGTGAGSYSGLIDEAGIYNRALSTAELDGIFKKGSAGKFDSGSPLPGSLAEANVTFNGATTQITGDNDNWQTAVINFTASQDGMPLTFEGLQPGILLDDVSLYEFPQSSSLYYIPEESLDAFKGESALGDWYLEMWDSRVGATNPVPVLEGWSLQFVFDRLIPAPTLPFIAATNINEGTLLTVTNTGSSLDTNQFLTYSVSSDAPGTNQPSIDANGVIRWTPGESQGPGTYTITTVVSDSQSPKQTAMNSFVVTVNEVNVAPVFNLVQTNYAVSVNSTLTVTNSATDADIPVNVLTYELFGPANSSIDTNTGVIRFTPDASQLLTTNVFKTVVTDTNLFALSTNSLSATNYFFVIVTPPGLTNGVPFTNNIPPGGFFYFAVRVPTNADFATNILLFATGPLNMFFNQTGLPTGTNAGDFTFLTNSLGGIGSPVLGLSTTPPLIPGSTYFLGLQNTNNFTVTNAIKVDFHLVLPTPIFYISDITYTNIGGTNGFLLTWFAATNQLFQVQWTPGLAPATWTTFTNPPVVTYDTLISPTNSLFKFFDNGSETGGFGPTRYYRLIFLGVVTTSNTPPVLPVQPDRTMNPLEPLTVTNTATDADIPVQTLSYALLNPPAGATISSNGVISWTPTTGQAGTSNSITTVVTDSGVPNLSATNTFAVIVNPLPTLSVTYTNMSGTNGNLLTWYAPTNDLFQVEFTDSLFPVNWQSFSNTIAYSGPVTPTNGLFSFFDDGSEHPFTGPRFYRLILLGVATPVNTPPSLAITSFGPGGLTLQWMASTNYQFQVEWTTNLIPIIVWTPFPDIITSTNGTFSFTDTNILMALKYYHLLLLP